MSEYPQQTKPPSPLSLWQEAGSVLRGPLEEDSVLRGPSEADSVPCEPVEEESVLRAPVEKDSVLRGLPRGPRASAGRGSAGRSARYEKLGGGSTPRFAANRTDRH